MSKKPLTVVTGNVNKIAIIERELGLPVVQQAIDIDEIQSLNLREVLEAKAREAYRKVQNPLIVQDTSLIFSDLNGLPGPFIRWFEELGLDGLCRLADLGSTRKAVVEIGVGYCNGDIFEAFIATTNGKITSEPKGSNGFGWDAIFVQDGQDRTRAELTEEEYERTSIYREPLQALRGYLELNK